MVSPLSEKYSPPSVSTPSTSKNTTRTACACSSSAGSNCSAGPVTAWGMAASFSWFLQVLNHLGQHQIADMHHAGQGTMVIHHRNAGNTVLLHHLCGLSGQSMGLDGARVRVHQLASAGAAQIGPHLQAAAQIAIGKD